MSESAPTRATSPSEIDPDDDRALLAEAVRSWTRIVAWVLTVGGAIGFVASFVLTVERIELFKNPDYVPSCNFNPVLSCGSVMAKPQAALFGFPNPLLGIAGFAVVITTGVAILAGARLAKREGGATGLAAEGPFDLGPFLRPFQAETAAEEAASVASAPTSKDRDIDGERPGSGVGPGAVTPSAEPMEADNQPLSACA